MNIKFYRYFGVQNKLSTETRLWGPIYLTDAGILIITLMILVGSNRFFWDCKEQWPKILYDISIVYLGIYTLIRPRSNPGKRNIQLLLLTFMPEERFFQSISTDRYIHMNSMFDMGNGLVKRLSVTNADLEGV